MKRILLLAALINPAAIIGSAKSDDPPTPAVPAVVAWATFDASILDVQSRGDKSRQLGIGSGKELLAALRPSEKPDQTTIAEAENQLAKVLNVTRIDWTKYRVMFRLGRSTRMSADHRLDLKLIKPGVISGQWTVKSNGKYLIWTPCAAALVERTNHEIVWDKCRHVDHGLMVYRGD